MKINVDCEKFKSPDKNGVVAPCNCHKTNKRWLKQLRTEARLAYHLDRKKK